MNTSAFNKVLSDNEIFELISQTQNILNSGTFDKEKDIEFIYKQKNSEFLIKHNYNIDDIIIVLKKLKNENYVQSILDTEDIDPLYLHEFHIKHDNIDYIYIKYKLINDKLCIKIVSFHKNEF